MDERRDTPATPRQQRPNHGIDYNSTFVSPEKERNHLVLLPADCQVPLILAWALSVHKSQGQTLERVSVDLRKTFEKGQGIIVA